MRYAALVVALAGLTGGGILAAQAPKANLADLPDPLVGTDSSRELSHGNTYPAVFRPFGMLAWTAQTSETEGWPYQYSKDKIIGFLGTHRPSAWMEDYGPFSLMPVSGELRVLPEARAASFQHQSEEARAYRYRVLLNGKIQAEVTPVAHGGVLRFTFPKTDPAYVIIDGNPGGSGVDIDVATNSVTGRNHSIRDGFPHNFAQHFVIVFDQTFQNCGTWGVPDGSTDHERRRNGERAGAWIKFEPGSTVTARVAVSLISLEQARYNLETEIGNADFDAVAAQGQAEWNRELGRIEIQGGTEAQRRTFYTGMYRAFQTPRAIHEKDPSGLNLHYSPYDGELHRGTLYADNGLWDTFRAQFPLLALIAPKRDGEIIRSFLNAYDEGGWIPKWPNPGYSNVMIGTHADSVIADAYLKGIRDYDIEKAYTAIRKDATEPGTGRYKAREGILDYLKLGYVPADKVKESAACTLEYAYDDFCVAQMARELDKKSDYRTFMDHSKNYKNIYDPETGFMRGRNSDRSWVQPFDPLAWGGVYTEGNAWQWLWSVQHDVAGLMKLMGGKAAFVKKLDELFSMTTEFKVGGYGRVIHEMTEAKMAGTGQYAHINEPCHHVIYLYDYAGQPWKTQQWARTIMDKFYRHAPDGWLGDEDTGQMSAWYIFSAMGFYPVNPGQPIYALGTPLFDRAILHLENGNAFTIEAERGSASDAYVQAAWLNGKKLDRVWINHSDIVAGGTLRFRLGAQPNQQWGTGGIPAAD